MNRLTEKQRQWLWFAALWGGGLAAVLALSYGFRWIILHV
jgi:hypothetical protein